MLVAVVGFVSEAVRAQTNGDATNWFRAAG